MEYIFALAGNPNCGKSTVFNELTGSRQYVGNWPGVTVEKEEGLVKRTDGAHTIRLMDLPGTYSLNPSSPEQKLARDYIESGEPKAVINIVDGTNLERNLFLTTQLLELGVPVVVGLNMMDIVEKRGDKINLSVLEHYLGIPFIPISASKNENLTALIDAAVAAAERGSNGPTGCSRCKAPCKTTAAQRYMLAEEAARAAYTSGGTHREYTEKIDRILLNKWLAIPIFLLVMLGVFSLTFGRVSSFLSDGVSYIFDTYIAHACTVLLQSAAAPAWLASLITEGILVGVGSILSFLPQIAILFLLLAILEDSGYMVRVSYILDRLMRPFGLGGKAFIPMIIGFGCSVPAIMSARTLDNAKERRLTILVTPFMSCSARLPIYVLITGVFFKEHQQLVVLSMYALGMAVALLASLVLSKTAVRDASTDFLLEIPPYRMPTFKNIALHVWERIWDFIERAATIIFLASIVVWLLQHLPLGNSGVSLLNGIGSLIAPVFRPLGFGDWRAASALITGVAAKEMVVATLEISGGNLTGLFTAASAVSFMVFTLLYIPCMATIAAIRNELKSVKWTVFAACFQIGTAWVIAFAVYHILRMCGL